MSHTANVSLIISIKYRTSKGGPDFKYSLICDDSGTCCTVEGFTIPDRSI